MIVAPQMVAVQNRIIRILHGTHHGCKWYAVKLMVVEHPSPPLRE